MEIIENLPLSDHALMAIELAVIAVCVMVLILNSWRKKKLRAITEIYVRKQRDDELTDRIKNNEKKDAMSSFKPYEVAYRGPGSSAGQAESSGIGTSIRLQLVLTTELSTKKFLLDLEKEIRIGRRETNEIVVDDKRVSAAHCVLVNRAGDVYAADLNSSNGTVLLRHSGRVTLGPNPVKIMDNDRLLLADVVSLDINIV